MQYCIYGQDVKPNIQFNNITTSQGLSNNHVSDICQDSFGFVWIGTTNGLCRYDAKESFTIYKATNDENPKLKSSNIRSLLTDSKNKLWIGTRLGGLTCFDQEKNEWETYLNDPNETNSLSNNDIISLLEDSKGRIWIGTEDGLNLFLPESKTFKSWKADKDNPFGLNNNAVLDIYEDHKGNIWFGLWNGGLTLVLNSDSNSYDDYKFRNFKMPGNISSANVWKIIEDTQNRIWVATHGGGLFIMPSVQNLSNEEHLQDWEFSPIEINITNNNTLLSNTIDHIIQDKKGDIWLATTNGLHHLPSKFIPTDFSPQFDPASLFFNTYTYDSINEEGICNNVLNKVFQSKEGIIWIGTLGGVSSFKNMDNRFEYFKINGQKDINHLNHNFVVLDNTIWIASDDTQLIRYDIENGSEQKINIPGLNEQTKLNAINLGDKNELIICTNKGVIEYNVADNSAKEYLAPKEILEQSSNLFARNILIAKDGQIFIATEFGLITLNRRTNTFRIHKKVTDDKTSLSDNSINDIFQDSNNNIWIGTYKGLNKVVSNENGVLKFKQFIGLVTDGNENVVSNQIIDLEEIDKVLYVGTTNGISLIDLNTHQSVNFDSPKVNSFVIAFEKDSKGNLWYSTTEGINSYNPKTKSTAKYGKNDGLIDRTFKLMTSFKESNGNIYFGSHLGISRINPNYKEKGPDIPPVYFTTAKKINNKEQETINLFNKDEIILEAKNYFLEINFIGLNYDRIEEMQYAYKLEGLDEDWFYTNKNTSAVYTNLKPGEYKFIAKAANYEGIWNDLGTSISITKKPSLLETKWAQFLLFAISLFCIWYIVKTYTKNIKKNNQVLMDFNNNLNNEIEERLKVEKDLLQTNQDLQQFAYSASHDLQEPLRNIGNAVGLLKRKNDFDDKSNEYVDIAVDGVKRMSSLIQNLLNYAKSGSNSLSLNQTNLNQLITNKIKGLSTLIEEKSAIILIKDLPTINCESNQIGIVFYNLINNAIKFNDKQKPEIEVGISENGPNDKWQFYVKDNGIGISPEYQNRIFTMFTRLENKREYEGTGIGLTLCQKIITRHNGTIWVSSTPKKGSTFFFTIGKNLQSNKDLN